METFSLLHLNEFLRRVVALNFPQPIWLTAELGQVSHSRGHWYIELLQKNEDANAEIVATSSAILWQNDALKLQKMLGKTFEQVLREGRQVKFKVEVEMHERYGLRLMVKDIDPHHTLGQAALQRQQVIDFLKKNGLLLQNKHRPLPPVLQNLAVITSQSAAGWQDFQQHLSQNIYGYSFDIQLFMASMQGKNAVVEVPAALHKIAERAADFDAIVIVRGGGARLDLAAFDQLEICQTAARSPLPILAGIGHDIDESVLDMLAHTSLKTPTAVADFLVQHNFLFENNILETAHAVQKIANNFLKINNLQLVQLENNLRWASREKLSRANLHLNFQQQQLSDNIRSFFQRNYQKLEQASQLIQAHDPAATLRRGFSITKMNGSIVRSVEEVGQSGQILETTLSDGVLISRVE